MAGVEEILRFFFSSSTSSSRKTDSHPLILLSGPRFSGKTSLLFQYAINSANAGIESQTQHLKPSPPPQVVFICNRRRLEIKPPYLSPGVDPSSQVFKLIQMKYVEGIEELNKYFAAFHLHDEFPVTVIVDDFGLLFDDSYCRERYNNPRGRDMAIVKTLALCCNAITHANETGHPCKLLLSDTHYGDLPRLLYIYRRWISSIFIIKGNAFGSYLLRRNPSQGPADMELQKSKIARYSIALQQLVLEGFLEDADQ